MLPNTFRTVGCDFETKDAAGGKLGVFSGYASTFDNVDRDDDVIVKGAFGTIETPRRVKLLWQHDMREPIGVWTDLREDAKGLFAAGELNLEVQRGREAYALMKQGAIGDMSIGFRTIESDVVKAESGGRNRPVRRLKKLKLYEVSLVSVPANPLATVDAVKAAARGAMLTEREFERRLRDAGVSRKLAQAIVAEGLDGIEGYFTSLLRDAAGLDCKSTRITLDCGYRQLITRAEDHEDDGADRTVASEEDAERVHLRDADGGRKAHEPSELDAVIASFAEAVGTISGDRTP